MSWGRPLWDSSSSKGSWGAEDRSRHPWGLGSWQPGRVGAWGGTVWAGPRGVGWGGASPAGAGSPLSPGAAPAGLGSPAAPGHPDRSASAPAASAPPWRGRDCGSGAMRGGRGGSPRLPPYLWAGSRVTRGQDLGGYGRKGSWALTGSTAPQLLTHSRKSAGPGEKEPLASGGGSASRGLAGPPGAHLCCSLEARSGPAGISPPPAAGAAPLLLCPCD